ncbi:UMP kinase [Patescibacteria group bacterium]|nr:UMP kinase [Patescibacteria group bacterium]MBU1952901.1 UMP kinase [Patescibacteria group bacterium]
MSEYKRVLLKLSGEVFGGEKKVGLDFKAIGLIALGVKKLIDEAGIQLAIVNGGGNLFRGRDHQKGTADPAQLDYIGMLGTIMNALALQQELNVLGVTSRVMSSLRLDQACEPFIRLRAVHHLEKGYVLILAGGTGSPFFTTDSAAALKAAEINADILLKGTNVDGVYDSDPKTNTNAKKFPQLTFQEALVRGLMVMDNTAFALCQSQHIPVVVFDVRDFNNVSRVIKGEKVGTLITP